MIKRKCHHAKFNTGMNYITVLSSYGNTARSNHFLACVDRVGDDI